MERKKLSISKISKSFCPIPWIQSGTDASGLMYACCEIVFSHSAYLMKDKTTYYKADVDIAPRNASVLKKLRSSMIVGKRSDLCRRCWDREAAGLGSRREGLLPLYPDLLEKAIKLTQADGTINKRDFPIDYYDLRFGNKCNCKCIMCNEINSSMWAGKVTDWSNNLNTPYIQELIQNAKYIKRIYFTGGEPTINSSHWKLVNTLIENRENDHIILEYNTNGVVLTKEMLSTWGKFLAVHLGFSIDGIGEIFEKIRFPAKWQTIEKNLKLFEEFSYPNTIAAFSITVSNINILNILDFFKWYSSLEMKKINLHPNLSKIYFPRKFDITRIPLDQKKFIKDEYEKFYTWLDNHFPYPDIKKVFEGVIKTLFSNEEKNI